VQGIEQSAWRIEHRVEDLGEKGFNRAPWAVRHAPYHLKKALWMKYYTTI
jgi:hypothetical protein